MLRTIIGKFNGLKLDSNILSASTKYIAASSFSSKTFSYQNASKQLLTPTLPCVQIQVANYRRTKFNHRKFYWVKRRGGGFDENISKDNQEFLDRVLIDKYADKDSPLKNAPWTRGEFNENAANKRLGVLAIKLGSVPQWTKDGKKFHATMLQVLDNHVIDYVPPEILMEKSVNLKNRTKEGLLGMAVVGALSSDPRLYTSQYLNLFKNSGVPPKRKLTKFMVSENAVVKPGTPLYATHYRVGDYIDVGAKTIGYGFQGVMKRFGFKGGPRSHGATKFHRKRGTVGSGRDRRPIKGMKMPGRMGSNWRSLMGLKIWRINTKYNILYVQGPAIPGPNHCYVRVTDCCLPKNRVNLQADNHPPFPTFFPEDLTEKLPEDLYDNNLHKFYESTIKFEDFEVKKIVKRDGAKLAKIKK